MTAPTDFPCRSFVYRKLLEHDANFEPLDAFAIAADFGDPAGEQETARRMGLADLSPLPRGGFKGAGTADWLAGQGLEVPEESNWARRQTNDLLLARLGPAEILVLGGLDGARDALVGLEAAWQAAGVPPPSPRGYPVPRQDSHFWFLVTGTQAAAMFAKVCGVDLRPAKFPVGRIAQTSVARMNAVAIREDLGDVPAYHLLGDGASGVYLWDCLLDAMAEFDGGPVGWRAARALAGLS